MHLIFSSQASRCSRENLEELLFLNPHQHRVREGILNSLASFGHPRVEGTDSGLTIRFKDHEAQALFVHDHDRSSDEPIGVVVFMRTTPSEIAIMQLAVHPDYTLRKQRIPGGLGLVLVQKVKEIAARIVGVERIVLFYRRELIINV